MNDLVSVIMPSYNTAAYIKQSIESVLAQTYPHWELIIVDDCSTDGTEAVLAQFTDSRIRIFRNEKNSGTAVSRNRALREARGRWVAFLDSDDVWYPQKLQKQLDFMEQHGYAFSYTGYEEMNADGATTGVRVTGPGRITKNGMFRFCWPGCLTVMYDASAVGLVQVFDIKKNNDYAMWLKVCRKADCYLLQDCLGGYRRGRTDSVSARYCRGLIAWHYRLFRQAEGMGVLASAFNTFGNIIFGLYKKIRYVKR